MRFTIDRNKFLAVLNRVALVTSKTDEVYRNVVISVSDDLTVSVMASDVEVTYGTTVDAKSVVSEGKIAVCAADITSIVRSLTGADLELTINKSKRIEIRCDRAVFRLPLFPVENVSIDDPIGTSFPTVEVTENALRSAVERMHFAVSSDDVRQGMNGAHMEIGDSGMRLVATDGYRAAESRADCVGAVQVPADVLIPRRVLALLRKILSFTDDVVLVGFGGNKMSVTIGDEHFMYLLIAGSQPDYRGVIPGSFASIVSVSSDALAEIVRRVTLLCDVSKPVVLSVESYDIEASSSSADRGDATDTCPAKCEGDTVKFGVNGKYLLDTLGAFDGLQVKLSIAGPLLPILVSSDEAPGTLGVVMPIRLT